MEETPLHKNHLDSSAKMVDFHGWNMPLNYGSQIKEHQEVRRSCGIFDVSHMAILDIEGKEASFFLSFILSNDVSRLKNNYDALYSAMLNYSGGVIDDLMVFKIPNGFRLVVNCARRESDLKWMKEHSLSKEIKIQEREDLCILAVQGPDTFKVLSKCLNKDFSEFLKGKKPFEGGSFKESIITTTGYTGEIGVEIMLPSKEAGNIWQEVIENGVQPVGLAARDTLRLEAGMNLYGFEMDENTSPLECNMEWTVDLKDSNRDFIGKKPFLEKKAQGNFFLLKGLLFEQKVVVRSHQEIFFDEQRKIRGVVTSGSYSPTLKKSIALARIPFISNESCWSEVRKKIVKAVVGQPRFVKNGKNVFKGKI